MSKDAGKTILALFAGLAAGVALGVLLAPEKGEDTRHKISDATNKITNDLRDKVLEGINKLRAKKDQYAQATSDLADEILS
ncbi:MAG TPA: YtxH domain-containing protein [Saprospiraceae bacterium]|jgi:gas vesicle protein|nr:MAG: YtxH-like protein [Candidatus Parvibacillus calidus]MBX2936021.1 YtxH domain-containing protein [Saprospiraceae bacterium]MBK7741497.1 YtxH domain-containing protein [Candidatus Parvibacillus calidus]MBX7180220.1 YtxH domain-containing protein [Saprospiraceae bacterium]MCB0590171.1 YtxH domain-containing protein [Saprospiraceae bacterium]